MPVLIKTEYEATVTWLGFVPAGEGLRAQPREALDLWLWRCHGGTSSRGDRAVLCADAQSA